jgi:hypothetical protein
LRNSNIKDWGKDLKDIKFRSSSNIAKNPLFNKHIDSRILTLNSYNEENNSKKSGDETSSLIDSENLKENSNKIKNSSLIKGKINLKKIDGQKATQEFSTSEEKPKNKKLNYHRRKNAYSNKDKKGDTTRKIRNSFRKFNCGYYCNENKNKRNSGYITAKNIHRNESGNLKKDNENGNLLKKFTLWKTIDSEITNSNFEDLKSTIRILDYFIKVLLVIIIPICSFLF